MKGYTPSVGHFTIRFANLEGIVAKSFLAAEIQNGVDMTKLYELTVASMGKYACCRYLVLIYFRCT